MGVCGQKTYQPGWPVRVTQTRPESCLPNLGVDCTPGPSPGDWPARPLEPQGPEYGRVQAGLGSRMLRGSRSRAQGLDERCGMYPARWASLGSRLCVAGSPASLVPATEARFRPQHTCCVCEPLVLLLRQNSPLAISKKVWAPGPALPVGKVQLFTQPVSGGGEGKTSP